MLNRNIYTIHFIDVFDINSICCSDSNGSTESCSLHSLQIGSLVSVEQEYIYYLFYMYNVYLYHNPHKNYILYLSIVEAD